MCSSLCRLLVDDLDHLLLRLAHVRVAPAPEFVGAVARALNSPLDHRRRHCLQVVGQPDARAEVNEVSGRVDAVVPDFRRFVIPGKHVVKIVPALAKRQ